MLNNKEQDSRDDYMDVDGGSGAETLFEEKMEEYSATGDYGTLLELYDLAKRLEDPVHLSRICTTLACKTEDESKKAQFWYEAGEVTLNQRLEAKNAVIAFQNALAAAPDNIHAFEKLCECYEKEEAWDKLAESYHDFIALNTNTVKAEQIGRIWRKFSLLLSERLDRNEDARTAAQKAFEINPSDYENCELYLDFIRRTSESDKRIPKILHKFLENQQESMLRRSALSQLIEYYENIGYEETAERCRDALTYFDNFFELSSFYVTSSKNQYRLNDALWNEIIVSPDMPINAARCFALIARILMPQLKKSPEDYGISDDALLQRDDTLFIVTLLKKFYELLGIPGDEPDLWLVDRLDGDVIDNSLISPTALLVERSTLRARNPGQIAYRLAQKLAFLRDDLCLAGFCSAEELALYLRTAWLVSVNYEGENSEAGQMAYRLLSGASKSQKNDLKEALFSVDLSQSVALAQRYLHAASLTAGRFAAFCVDDFLTTIRAEKTPYIRDRLFLFMISEKYLMHKRDSEFFYD